MHYWLMKSEPNAFSWDDLIKDGRTHWDGVRNYQARAHLMAMKINDLCFFYHSIQGKEIVGIARVIKEYYPDPSDASGKFGMVDIVPVDRLPVPVSLAIIKNTPDLASLPLIRQSRLSVMPIDRASWMLLCKMASYSAP